MPKSSSAGENINHFHGTRLRVLGNGFLRMRWLSYSAVNDQTLAILAMAPTNNREPTVLSNFKEQRARLEITTTDIDETFDISRIVIFIRPLYTSFPG